MKIVSVKKRGWLMRVLSINHYRVTVENEGKTTSYNCWAGISTPDQESLLWSLRKSLKADTMEKDLLGKEITLSQ